MSTRVYNYPASPEIQSIITEARHDPRVTERFDELDSRSYNAAWEWVRAAAELAYKAGKENRGA